MWLHWNVSTDKTYSIKRLSVKSFRDELSLSIAPTTHITEVQALGKVSLKPAKTKHTNGTIVGEVILVLCSGLQIYKACIACKSKIYNDKLSPSPVTAVEAFCKLLVSAGRLQLRFESWKQTYLMTQQHSKCNFSPHIMTILHISRADLADTTVEALSHELVSCPTLLRVEHSDGIAREVQIVNWAADTRHRLLFANIHCLSFMSRWARLHCIRSPQSSPYTLIL